MKLAELFNIAQLEQLIQHGYITRRVHPYYPIAILNHTSPNPAGEGEMIQRCCGVIVDSNEIIGQSLPELCNQSDIILVCFYGRELIVSTRNEFESEDALWAYRYVSDNYYAAFRLLCYDGITALLQRIDNDLYLVGTVTPDLLSNGKQIWTSANRLTSWPGKKIDLIQHLL